MKKKLRLNFEKKNLASVGTVQLIDGPHTNNLEGWHSRVKISLSI